MLTEDLGVPGELDKAEIEKVDANVVSPNSEFLIPNETIKTFQINSFEDTIERIRTAVEDNKTMFLRDKEGSIAVLATFPNQVIVASSDGKIQRADIEKQEGSFIVKNITEIDGVLKKEDIGKFISGKTKEIIEEFFKSGTICNEKIKNLVSLVNGAERF